MQRNTLLIVMVAAGSALCWWPVIIQPNLDLPVWKTPLIFLALITALATALSNEGAGWFMSASILGVFAGICCSFRLWWPTDNDVPYVLAVGVATLVSIPVSVIAVAAGVALRESKIAQKNRRLIWCAFLSSFAFAPMVVALTPLLLTRRR
jgi:ethanolamine transporter EutH